MKTKSLSKIVFGCSLLVYSICVFAKPDPAALNNEVRDPGVRGGLANTGGGLQQRGIPIPHPPLISPNPTTGATVNKMSEHLSKRGFYARVNWNPPAMTVLT